MGCKMRTAAPGIIQNLEAPFACSANGSWLSQWLMIEPMAHDWANGSWFSHWLLKVFDSRIPSLVGMHLPIVSNWKFLIRGFLLALWGMHLPIVPIMVRSLEEQAVDAVVEKFHLLGGFGEMKERHGYLRIVIEENMMIEWKQKQKMRMGPILPFGFQHPNDLIKRQRLSCMNDFALRLGWWDARLEHATQTARASSYFKNLELMVWWSSVLLEPSYFFY